jgi:hypothetical protein
VNSVRALFRNLSLDLGPPAEPTIVHLGRRFYDED